MPISETVQFEKVAVVQATQNLQQLDTTAQNEKKESKEKAKKSQHQVANFRTVFKRRINYLKLDKTSKL